MLQYSCLENPSPWQRRLAGHIYSFSKSWTRPKRLWMHKYSTSFFFAFGSSAPVRVECEGGTPAWLAGTVTVPSVQDTNCLFGRSYGPVTSSHPLNLSLHSQQQPSHWDCFTIPKLQLPPAAPSRRPVFLPGICMAAPSTVWFSFHLGCHRSAVSLSALNVSPLTQTIAPLWGLDPCFRSPTRQE